MTVSVVTIQYCQKQHNMDVALCRTIRTQLTCRYSILANNVAPHWCSFLQQLARILATRVGNDDRKHYLRCGDRPSDMLATRGSNHVEPATLVFRHTTRIWDVCVLPSTQNVLTFGSYYSMETYDETLASLTHNAGTVKYAIHQLLTWVQSIVSLNTCSPCWCSCEPHGRKTGLCPCAL